MFENIPLLILAYVAVGVILTYLKMWRAAYWYDHEYLEQARGFERDIMLRQPTLRAYLALPFPTWPQRIVHVIAWPIELLILTFSGGSLLLVYVLLFATIICAGAIIGIGYYFIKGALWIIGLPFKKRA